MKDGSVLKNVEARSKELFAALHSLKASPTTGHLIADVRGMGLMVGVQFAGSKLTLPPRASQTDNQPKKAAQIPEKIASRVQQKCLEKGMLVLTTSVYETVCARYSERQMLISTQIRFIPPLIVSEGEMKQAIGIIKESIEEVAAEQ